MGGGVTGSEYRLRKGTRCMAPEMELSMRACRATALCGKAWQDEAKPRGGAVAKYFLDGFFVFIFLGIHRDGHGPDNTI